MVMRQMNDELKGMRKEAIVAEVLSWHARERNEQKPGNPPVRIVSVPAKTRKKHLQNTGLERCQYVNKLRIFNHDFIKCAHHELQKFCKDSYMCTSPLKTEILHNFTYKSSPYLTGNTLRLHYKAQPVNAVWGNSRCLL
jgi:hypothetical protein